MDYDKVLCGRMYIDGQLTYSEVGIADGRIAEVGKHVVGGEEGTKPRQILMTMDEFESVI